MVCGVGLAVSQYRTPVLGADPVKTTATKAPDKAAVERTREQVQMLDDLYKTAVVKITKVYVGQQGEVPAAIAAMEIFHEMKKKGWHDARITARQSFTLDPASPVLHYAQEIFEGLKAYRRPNGAAALFRPEAQGRKGARA